ncbi:MAG: MFS transporter [Planctomycetes bacterium]|nr:MFS transporter [Planctomycetota bacterium]
MITQGETIPDTSARNVRIWWFAGLLLLASAINYMDRQTLANAAVRISGEFKMSQEQYGNLEAGFGWAFAVGSLFFGFLADKVSVRWLYAAVVLLWSAMGFLSGFVENYEQLLVCRTLLGFFEAGHWPCGIKTIRALLDARGRAMGNGVLQSGTSIGAIATPLIMSQLLTDDIASWRLPFQVIGAVGALWVIAWIVTGPRDASLSASVNEGAASGPWWRVLLDRRMLIILAVVALINTTWQLLRAWLPKFLQEGRGYAEYETLYFNSVWFAATDVGCLGAGAVALWLARRGRSVLQARLLTFFACALMCLLTMAVPWLSSGWLLLGLLLVAGAGALGVFPIYHAFTQDISHDHQGKVTGIAGVAAWAFSPFAQRLFGRHVDETHSFDQGLAVAGCLPLVACLLLIALWPRTKNTTGD